MDLAKNNLDQYSSLYRFSKKGSEYISEPFYLYAKSFGLNIVNNINKIT